MNKRINDFPQMVEKMELECSGKKWWFVRVRRNGCSGEWLRNKFWEVGQKICDSGEEKDAFDGKELAVRVN